MDIFLGRVGNGYRLCVMGDLNGWVKNRMRDGIIGESGVSGESKNERTGVHFCAERALVTFKMCSFEGDRRDNNFGREPLNNIEMKARVKKLMNN